MGFLLYTKPIFVKHFPQPAAKTKMDAGGV
jgi:hypothetical protein